MSNIKKLLPLFCCLLSVRLAAAEKKINLEDIENENLANEQQRQYKQNFVYVQQEGPVRYVLPAQAPNHPEMQYGFRPMKTQHEYQQQQQQQQQQSQNVDTVQYNAQQQYSEQLPNEQQYVVQGKQQIQQPEQFYLNTNQLLQDNSNLLQQFYQQQLAYLQPQTAATNTIQAEPDNKGGIQYVMYVPNQYLPEAKGEPTQAVQTVQEYTQDYSQQYAAPEGRTEQQVQYIEVPVTQPEVEYQQQKEKQIQQPHYVPQQIQIPQPVRFAQKSHLPRPKSSVRPYEVDRVPNYDHMTQQYNPKSLVDSYVPSVLQLQYMKQQFQQGKPLHDKTHVNLIGQHVKPRPPNGPKKGFLKNVVNDFIASAQTHNYRYAPPQRYYIRQ